MKSFIKTLLVTVLALIVSLLVAVILFLWLTSSTGNRFALYDIARELHRGMDRPTVETVIEHHMRPYLHRRDSQSEIVISTELNAADFLSLTINFKDGHLVSTLMVGEDNPQDVLPDQPPDISENHE